MKKKLLVGVMFAVGLAVWHFTGGAVVWAQLVGVEKHDDHLWMPASKQVRLGNKPESYLTYESNKLKLNVDTGKTIEMLVNGTAEYDFTSTAADFKGNNITTTGTLSAGAVSATGMQTFSSGAAVTAGSYQMGRDADATNQLHLNVPTGAGLEISVNDVAEYVLNATQADFKANNFVTTGTVGGGAATFTSGSFSDGDVTNVGDIALDSISTDAVAGTMTLKGNAAGTNKEDLTLDFETVANTVGLSSSTGVTAVDFGTIGVAAGNFDASDGDITNVGSIKVDSVDADGITVNYNDVNILELPQADLGATCTLGQISIDTGGATKELCYCQAENTWLCTALAAGPTD